MKTHHLLLPVQIDQRAEGRWLQIMTRASVGIIEQKYFYCFFISLQVMRHENSSILELNGKEVSEFTPSKPREKWLRKRTHVKIRVRLIDCILLYYFIPCSALYCILLYFFILSFS